ncbi:MAG TPA: exo-beta-N-acetylmuramidase NamZ domain-containing protein, partial [Desulfobaccales bacterium]
IFGPMGLKDTSFRPRSALQLRMAPCDLRCGQVQDPTAYRMGGVAGNAGVFSTADDLAVFAQMILDGGTWRGLKILSPKAVAAMTKPQSVPGSSTRRGLGWDIRSPYSRIFNAAFPAGSFGHTGYTGTAIWIEPRSKTFLIILTNRLYPNGRGQVKTLRARVAAAVAAAVPMGRPALVAALADGEPEPTMGGHGASDTPDRVQPGIEVLAASGFADLKGKNIGVITNQTGVDAAGRPTLSRLLRAPGVKVRAIFSPEHGLYGNLDEKVSSGRDPATGLPVYSLYGKTLKPTARMLHGLDALVYDIQDVGTRFYTYISTMTYAMQAAAGANLDFYVLDRPDPIGAAAVQGPVLDADLCSFVGCFTLPVRYGMTVG